MGVFAYNPDQHITSKNKSNTNGFKMYRNQTIQEKAVAVQIKKVCGNLEPQTLQLKHAIPKHKLKLQNTKLKDMRMKAERSRINYQSFNNQKKMYRSWKSKQIEVTSTLQQPKISKIFVLEYGRKMSEAA